MTDAVLARVVALSKAPLTDLKKQWRDLFGKEPPPYNRRFLESRLAYRIQELAHGGLKPETIRRLEELGESVAPAKRLPGAARRKDDRPIDGTRLVREYQGIAYEVTVRGDHFEYRGDRYTSLSAIARLITGTRWNGWVFFGLRTPRRAS
jgi:hypothetical protein